MIFKHRARPLVAHLHLSHRAFSTTRTMSTTNGKLRIGYVPEHFATPLHFAYTQHGLSDHATLQSFPSGTGTMIEAFHNREIDVGIGLTESWIVGLSKTTDQADGAQPYHIVGSYTLSPLTWAISVGANSDIKSTEDLKGKKVGISRVGSGSHIMSSVLAQKNGWQPFEYVVCGPFKPLRDAVNHGKADFFMWEHFTTKRWFDSGELRRVGELPTPWNAWQIAAAGEQTDPRVKEVLLPALDKGVEQFKSDKGAAVKYISENMEYSREDASEWYEGVKFASPKDMRMLNSVVIDDAVAILKTAGVLGPRTIGSYKDLQSKS